MPLNEKQFNTVEVIMNSIMKLLCVIVALVCFVWAFARLLDSPLGWDTAKFGGIDTMLGYTCYRVFNHYFPSGNKPNTNKRLSNKKKNLDQLT